MYMYVHMYNMYTYIFRILAMVNHIPDRPDRGPVSDKTPEE